MTRVKDHQDKKARKKAKARYLSNPISRNKTGSKSNDHAEKKQRVIICADLRHCLERNKVCVCVCVDCVFVCSLHMVVRMWTC